MVQLICSLQMSYMAFLDVFERPRTVYLFSDTKRAENQVQDVVGRSCAGDLVQRAQRVVEIEQDHLVGSFMRHGDCSGVEGGDRILHQLLVADVGEEAALRLAGT